MTFTIDEIKVEVIYEDYFATVVIVDSEKLVTVDDYFKISCMMRKNKISSSGSR